jgi:hypothetical protein
MGLRNLWEAAPGPKPVPAYSPAKMAVAVLGIFLLALLIVFGFHVQ